MVIQIKRMLKCILLFPILFSILIILLMPLVFANGSGNKENSGGATGMNPIAIDINHPSYKADNPFWPKFNGQCTWYVWSRVHQLYGKKMPTRDAKLWYELASNMGYPVGTQPAVNSVVVLGGTIYGHVAYVEAWDGTNITISEANSNWKGYMPPNGVGLNASDTLALEHMQTVTYDYETYQYRYLLSGLKITGFIYLE